MRILLFDDRRDERETIAKILMRNGYQIEVAGDETSAIAALTRMSPQVIVFSPSAKGCDQVHRLKSVDASGQAYLIALVDAAPVHTALVDILEAGVNDFMRRPVVEAELLERVKAPPRLIHWLKSVATPAAFDFSAPIDVTSLRAWQSLGVNVAADLSEIVGQPFSVRAGWPKRFASRVLCATIPMSLAGDQLEVRVSIAADRQTLDWLRASVLGDASADEAATNDLVREFANTAGGALKRAALRENVTLTTGIPVNEHLENRRGGSCWTLTLDGTDACIVVFSEIKKKENQRVPATRLCEGMIIAHDVRNEGGILLIPAGSRLTSSTASKLSKMLGSRTFVEVAPAT